MNSIRDSRMPEAKMVELEMTANGPRICSKSCCKYAWYGRDGSCLCGIDFCKCGVSITGIRTVPWKPADILDAKWQKWFRNEVPCRHLDELEVVSKGFGDQNIKYGIGRTFCLLVDGFSVFCYFDFPAGLYMAPREYSLKTFLDMTYSFAQACEIMMERMREMTEISADGADAAIERLAEAMLAGEFSMTPREKDFFGKCRFYYDCYEFVVQVD